MQPREGVPRTQSSKMTKQDSQVNYDQSTQSGGATVLRAGVVPPRVLAWQTSSKRTANATVTAKSGLEQEIRRKLSRSGSKERSPTGP